MFTNFLLTENTVITGKYQTEVLTVRTKPGGLYMKTALDSM